MRNPNININNALEIVQGAIQRSNPDKDNNKFFPADHRGSGWHGGGTRGAIQSAEDRLLDALESGDDTLYDGLINPKTGMPFTEAEKFDALQNAINREISAIESNRPIHPGLEQRLDKLNVLLEDVENSDIIHTLNMAGIDVALYPNLVGGLGSPAVAEAFVLLYNSEVPVRAKTAQAILNGDVDIFNIHDETIRVIDSDGNRERVANHPETGEEYEIKYASWGVREGGTNNVWILDTNSNGDPRSPETIANTMVHEVNHVANPFPENYGDFTDEEKAMHSYKREFTAFWVSGRFDNYSEAERGEAIRNFILENYDFAKDLNMGPSSRYMPAIEGMNELPEDFNIDNSFP